MQNEPTQSHVEELICCSRWLLVAVAAAAKLECTHSIARRTLNLVIHTLYVVMCGACM